MSNEIAEALVPDNPSALQASVSSLIAQRVSGFISREYFANSLYHTLTHAAFQAVFGFLFRSIGARFGVTQRTLVAVIQSVSGGPRAVSRVVANNIAVLLQNSIGRLRNDLRLFLGVMQHNMPLMHSVKPGYGLPDQVLKPGYGPPPLKPGWGVYDPCAAGTKRTGQPVTIAEPDPEFEFVIQAPLLPGEHHYDKDPVETSPVPVSPPADTSSGWTSHYGYDEYITELGNVIERWTGGLFGYGTYMGVKDEL